MAISAAKLLPGVESGDNIVVSTKAATFLPTAKIIPSRKEKGVIGLVNIVPGDDDDAAIKVGGTKIDDKINEDVSEIRGTTKKIHTILKQTVKINLQKVKLQRKNKENLKRKNREDSMESKKDDDRINKKDGPSLPKIGFFERIKNFFKQILGGYLLLKLVDFLPQMLAFAKAIQLGKLFDFIVDFSIGLFDKLVSFIDIGYGVVDKVNGITEDLFGEDAAQKLKDFQGLFVKFMNLAIIAAMLSGGGSNPLGGNKGRGPTKPGFDRTGRRVNAGAQQRYRKRFGDKKFAQRFGDGAGRRLDRIQQASNTTRSAQQRYASRFGAGAAKNRFGQVVGGGSRRVAARGAGRIAGKIPIVGPLIDFGIRTLVFKDPVGKAAAAAVGAGVGQALGTFLGGAIGGIVGSVVPFVGNLLVGGAGATIGGLIGGIIGDQIGASLYNVLVGTESGGEGAESVEAKAQGGSIGDEDVKKQEDAERERIRRARVQQFNVSKQKTPAESELSKNDPGEDKRTIFQKIFGVVKEGGPLELIKKARERLSKRNNSMISKIMSLGVDLLAGKKPDRRVIGDIAKNLTTFFDAALPAPMTMLRQLLQKLQSGGMVVENPAQTQQRLREVTGKIQSALVRDATTVANGVLNDIKTIAEKTVLGPATAAAPKQSTERDPLEAARQSNQARRGNRKASQGIPLSGGTGALMSATGTTGAGNVANPNASTSVSITPFAKGSGASISSAFGQRTLNGRTRAHNGLDIAAATGTPMYAYLDGEVTHVNDLLGAKGKDAGYGYWIVWKDDKNGHYHFFGHLDRPPALGVGKKFKAGALLGQVGGSGHGKLNKYGPHLHWEISKQAPSSNGQFSSYIDPIQWVNNHGASLTPPQAIQTSLNTNLSSSNVASNASYEQTGVQLAVITKEVPVTRTVTTTRTNHRGRTVTTKQPVISA